MPNHFLSFQKVHFKGSKFRHVNKYVKDEFDAYQREMALIALQSMDWRHLAVVLKTFLQASFLMFKK